MKIAEVLWEDAIWDMDGEFEKFRLSRTVGYVLTEDEDHILLSQECDAFGENKSVTRIPMSIVRSVLIVAE
jgi:hypothetical protein